MHAQPWKPLSCTTWDRPVCARIGERVTAQLVDVIAGGREHGADRGQRDLVVEEGVAAEGHAGCRERVGGVTSAGRGRVTARGGFTAVSVGLVHGRVTVTESVEIAERRERTYVASVVVSG